MSPIPRFVSRMLVIALLLPIATATTPRSMEDVAHAAVDHQGHDHDTLTTSALPPGGTFTDDNGNTFEGLIEAIAARGITKGCNPPANDRFCPDDAVTRGEMAVFLVRAFNHLALNARNDFFSDDEGAFYEHAANQIRTARVTRGCNPPGNDRYCGDDSVTRGQMAAFLSRALELTDDGGGDHFDDDDNSTFESDIDRLREAGITSGCNPPENDEFCPNDAVTRGQMAAFIARALGLKPIKVPPPSDNIPPGRVITGTLELKGHVSLNEDLIVVGGTLVARPGVHVEGNGHQIMFMNGGKADFQGTKVAHTWSGNGADANLKRDIVFNNMRRIMFHHGAGKSTLRYFTISNSGTPGVLGDYPLHFHLNKNSTRGTLVEGVVVVNGRNHAFVPHGSHGITFRDTIAWNTSDTAYWWDQAGTNVSSADDRRCPEEDKYCTTDNSNDITYDHALAYDVEPRAGDHGHRVSGFVLRSGSGNVIKNSAATKIRGGADCAGYHWPEDANKNVGGNVWVFENNRSSSSDCHGIFVWQNDGNNHVVRNFTGDAIDHGAYGNSYHYINANVPYVEVHASGWKMTGGHATAVRAAPGRFEGTITFTDIVIGSFTIDNAESEERISYRLNNTGISCGEIVYRSVRADTRVWVNNNPCSIP